MDPLVVWNVDGLRRNQCSGQEQRKANSIPLRKLQLVFSHKQLTFPLAISKSPPEQRLSSV